MAGSLKVTIRRVASSQGMFFRGLSDYEADDAIGEPYTDRPYFPRNWTPPNLRPSVPEVRRFEYSGDQLYMTAGIEWAWFYAFRFRNPSWSEETARDLFRRHTRDDAGFTNKCGSDTRYSFVLGTNAGKKPMQLLGIVCPGGNRFRATGSAETFKKDQVCQAVWNLDYDWLAANLTQANARDFAASLPDWLLFTARTVHPVLIAPPKTGAPNGEFLVTSWDGRFPVPLVTQVGRQEVVDGFHCRENWLQSNRLERLL